MKKLTYILVIILLASCGSHKQVVEQKKVDKTKTKTDEITEKLTESVNDTLQGSVPLSQLSSNPIVYNFGSAGTRLNLKLQKGRLTYKATTKATKKTVERTQKKEDIQKNETEEIETETQTKTGVIPWWLSGAVILLIVGVFKLISKKFKIIKI